MQFKLWRSCPINLSSYTYTFWYRYQDGYYHKTKRQKNGLYRIPDMWGEEEAICGLVNPVVLTCVMWDDAEPKCQGCLNWLIMMELAE